MKKLILFLLISSLLYSAPIPIPEIESTIIQEEYYFIRIDYIKKYNQAVFIFSTKEELFIEETAAILIEEQIEIFQKEKGYFGYKSNPDDYIIRYYNNLVKYTKPVVFIYSSK